MLNHHKKTTIAKQSLPKEIQTVQLLRSMTLQDSLASLKQQNQQIQYSTNSLFAPAKVKVNGAPPTTFTNAEGLSKGPSHKVGKAGDRHRKDTTKLDGNAPSNSAKSEAPV